MGLISVKLNSQTKYKFVFVSPKFSSYSTKTLAGMSQNHEVADDSHYLVKEYAYSFQSSTNINEYIYLADTNKSDLTTWIN